MLNNGTKSAQNISQSYIIQTLSCASLVLDFQICENIIHGGQNKWTFSIVDSVSCPPLTLENGEVDYNRYLLTEVSYYNYYLFNDDFDLKSGYSVFFM